MRKKKIGAKANLLNINIHAYENCFCGIHINSCVNMKLMNFFPYRSIIFLNLNVWPRDKKFHNFGKAWPCTSLGCCMHREHVIERWINKIWEWQSWNQNLQVPFLTNASNQLCKVCPTSFREGAKNGQLLMHNRWHNDKKQ